MIVELAKRHLWRWYLEILGWLGLVKVAVLPKVLGVSRAWRVARWISAQGLPSFSID
jgi:hypothetical protein